MNIMLTARTGFTRGASWPIANEPLLIGRAPDCDVVIDDVSVSRRQCQLRRDGAGVHLLDLGGKNPILVNNRPVENTLLQVGDEFAIGTVGFLISANLSSFPDRKSPVLRETTRTLAMQDLERLNGKGDAQLPADPAVLFGLSRRLSRAATKEDVYTSVTEAVSARFPEASISFLVREALSWREEGGDRWPERAEVHTPYLDSAVEHNHAITAKDPQSPHADATLMVAPLTCGPQPLGVCVLRAKMPAEAIEEDGFLMFATMAELVGPYLHSLDRTERLAALSKRLAHHDELARQIIGDSKSMRAVRSRIREAAKTNLHVLIQGETGTGKEIVARAVHANSDRADRPYVIVNCAAIPDELFESELFGHVRGAFTGATRAKEGLIKLADGGFLFLDEIGDLSPQNQARLLRVIEDGTFRPLGDVSERQVNLRVIAATNKPLEVDTFRDDLYYRLSGVVIEIPPLRKRPSDIPLLAQYFIDKMTASSAHMPCGITDAAVDALRSYRWPGNVRELRNVIERAAHTSRGNDLSLLHLKNLIPFDALADSDEPPKSLAAIEREHIGRVLDATAGNMSKAAQILGVSRSTLYQKVRDYGLRP